MRSPYFFWDSDSKPEFRIPTPRMYDCVFWGEWRENLNSSNKRYTTVCKQNFHCNWNWVILYPESESSSKGRLQLRAKIPTPGNSDSTPLIITIIIVFQFPQTGELIVKRLIIQFRKGYRRSDKSLCMSASRFVAHLINQRVVSILLPVKDSEFSAYLNSVVSCYMVYYSMIYKATILWLQNLLKVIILPVFV